MESLQIEVAGPIGSLRAAGFVRTSDKKFTSAIHFYDPQNARQQHLSATNLRLKDTTPHLVLRNTSGVVIAATPRFLPPTGDGGSTVQLPPISLNPNQDVEVDLRPLMAAAATRPGLQIVSVQVLNDGMNGSLIGALCATDTITRITYDVPLRDSGPIRNSTGSYPWRLDGDYSTLISITNVGAAPAKFTVTINYEGGKYLPQIQDLAVGETIVFDVGQLRKEQIPDNTTLDKLRLR